MLRGTLRCPSPGPQDLETKAGSLSVEKADDDPERRSHVLLSSTTQTAGHRWS